jgi:hypothetical protein
MTHKLSFWLMKAAPASLRVQQGEAHDYSLLGKSKRFLLPKVDYGWLFPVPTKPG